MDILTSLMTPLIGCITAWIAYQQYRTNRQAELRQARAAQMAVYKNVKRLLNHIDSYREVPDDHYENFLASIAEADFLFDESIRDWLSDIESQIEQLNSWGDAIISLKIEHNVLTKPDEILKSKAPDDFSILQNEIENSIDTLQNYHRELRDKFTPYLSNKE